MLFYYSSFPGKIPKVKFRLRFLSFFSVGVKSQISLKLVKRMREFDQSAYRYFFFFVCHRRIEHIGKARVISDIRLVLLISFMSTPRRSSEILKKRLKTYLKVAFNSPLMFLNSSYSFYFYSMYGVHD